MVGFRSILISRINRIGIILLFLTGQAHAIPEKDTGNLGEIRYSILSLEKFQRIYGTEWVLMNGDDVRNSDLVREGLWAGPTIPDARGLYLRGKNYDRDRETGDPNGNRRIGHRYSDVFKSHKHEDLGHVHDFSLNFATSHGVGGGQPGRGGGHGLQSEGIGGAISLGKADIQDTGGKETRPRSLVVNTFIKINRTREDQSTNTLLDSIRGIPAAIARSSNLASLIRRIVQEELRRGNRQ